MFAQPCTVPSIDNKLQQCLPCMSEDADTTLDDSSSTAKRQAKRERSIIANLYRYSDLSVEAIAQQVDMDAKEVQKIVDNLVKNDALEVVIDQSTTKV